MYICVCVCSQCVSADACVPWRACGGHLTPLRQALIAAAVLRGLCLPGVLRLQTPLNPVVQVDSRDQTCKARILTL